MPEFIITFKDGSQTVKNSLDMFYALSELNQVGHRYDIQKIEERVSITSLSRDAERLLKEAAKTVFNKIVYTRTIGDNSIIVHHEEFVKMESRRQEVYWEEVLKELVFNNLIEEVERNGFIVYKVTQMGFNVVDKL